MRLLCILLIVCLLAVGPVSAIAVNPVAAPDVTRAGSAIRPAVSMVPARTIVTMPITPSPLSPMLSISSVPAGAAVTVDGTVKGITPVTIGLYPGSHAVLLTLDGYRDYTTTVNLAEGSRVAIEAKLERDLKFVASRQNISAIRDLETLPVITRTIPGGLLTYEAPDSCTSDQQCLTLAEAEVLYPGQWWYIEGAVCGYAVSANNQSVPQYCTGGETGSSIQPAIQSGSVPSLVTVPTGIKVKVVNASRNLTVPAESVTRIPQVLGGRRQIGVLDSVLGFFNGLFSNPVCPKNWTACGGRCIDVMNDSLNCGSCDYTCFDPAICVAGECDYPPPPPWASSPGDVLL